MIVVFKNKDDEQLQDYIHPSDSASNVSTKQHSVLSTASSARLKAAAESA